MTWVFNILLLALACRWGMAQYYTGSGCRDVYNGKSYSAGSTYMRTKQMGNTTLQGTYRCRCHEGGMMRCSAVDIPCYDSSKGDFAPKQDRFNTLLRGQKYNCICLGGRGKFSYCRRGWSDRDSCKDVGTDKAVSEGSTYLTERFGARVRCVCGKGGVAVRGSCERTGCTDSVTSRTVSVGSPYTVASFGRHYRCKCGSDGRPLRGSCGGIAKPVVNPCEAGTSTCHRSLAVCTPRGASYDCECLTGYDGDGTSCNDIDECARQNRCDENALCSNTQGSYTCSCNEGYSGDGFECSENVVDHCAENAVFCSIFARCVSNPASFSCICFEGYTGDGMNCSDVDECATDAHTCDTNAACKNTERSYMCFCNVGYSGDGRRCTQMCRDEKTGIYVQPHDVFVKVTNGRNNPCTCGENGQELAGSCLVDQEPQTIAETTTTTTTATTTPAPETATQRDTRCVDSSTGQYVRSGQYYTRRVGRVEQRCRCRDGEAEGGTCRTNSKLSSADKPTCGVGSKKYDVDEEFTFSTATYNYRCTCLLNHRGRATSRCRPVSRRN